MNPRVLLLSTSLGLGGADRQILYLAKALLANGYDVRLVTMVPPEEMGRQALAEGLPITSLNMQRGRADAQSFRRFVSLLRDWQPHVLTSFMYHANILGRVAGRMARVPLIVSSIRSERNGSSSRDWLLRLTNWMDDSCTTNSQQVADSLAERRLIPRHKLRVIPNGVDLDALTATPEDARRVRNELGVGTGEFLWLAVGRLLEQKDYPTMLEAFQPLAGSQARLAIAGRGPELEALQRDVQERGIAASVSFLGVRHDVAVLLRAADGFVLSSAWEGMPNVVMEALASATPVVATEVGGVSELVERGRSGYLVPPRNAPALSTAMQQLMMLPVDARRSMGLTGRERISANYGLARMAQRWIALFEELLAQKEVAVSLSHREALVQDGGR